MAKTTAPAFHDAASLENTFLKVGLSEGAARQLAGLGRYSLHLSKAEPQNGAKPVFTKIGGVPDLPDSTPWPIRPRLPQPEKPPSTGFLGKLLNGLFHRKPSAQEDLYSNTPQPYNFIAQISFAEMGTAHGLNLPQSGALYLFYDDLVQSWGFAPEDSIGFKLIYVDDISTAKAAPKPAFFEHVPSYNARHCRPKLAFENPQPEGRYFEALDLSEADSEMYFDFWERAQDRLPSGWSNDPRHKLCGWSDNEQNPMEEECALVTSGINCGGPEGYNTPDAKRIMAAPNEWVLLLQIDSDDHTGMMWGDAGRLYVWIKKSDLEQRNFDNTWLILQCG